MLKLQRKNAETAQGMVEFALVLPILLMVIMGVFAFGHLFFVYSTLVSASREAARFGSAVGVTDSGKPRYKACDEIIGAAVNIGKLAGVTASNVKISYDDGPDDTNAADNGTCPAGGEGPEVDLGDRIKVDINVQYTPIVPLVPIPSFNLNGQTHRTIIKDLAVGDAPDAEDPCTTDTQISSLSIVPNISTGAIVNQVVTFTAPVVTVKPASGYEDAVGNVNIESGGTLLCSFTLPATSCTYAFPTTGTFDISATFVPNDPGGCFIAPATATTITGYPVKQLSGTMTLTANPTTSEVGSSPTFSVILPTGEFTAGQTVLIYDTGLAMSNYCSAVLDSAGKGSCQFIQTTAGNRTIKADYGSMTASITYVVTENVPDATTTTIVSDTPDPSEPGAAVTVKVKVAPSAVGSLGTPTGTVTVTGVGPTSTTCTGTLSSGNVSCSLTFSTEGTYTLQATYSGDANFASSTSATVSHTVKKALVCPTASAMTFTKQGNTTDGFTFSVTESTNPGVTVSKIQVNYSLPANTNNPKLSSITKTSSTVSNNDLFKDSSGVTTHPFIIDQVAQGWYPDFISGSDLTMPVGQAQTFTFNFKSNLITGNQVVTIWFSNTCTVSVTGTY